MKKRTMAKRFFTACTASLALLVPISSFAAAPAEYDGQSYDSMGYTSEDPDGVFNLAVIAKGDVKIIGNAMYIEGSVYSGGNIYVSDGQGNKVDGLFISGTEGTTYEGNGEIRSTDGYIHVNSNGTTDGITYWSTAPEYNGAIKDTDTSFGCSYEDFEVPAIANDMGNVKMDVYADDVWKWSADRGSYSEPGPDGVKTITEDTHIGQLTMNGSQDNWRGLDAAMTIDTTNGDVTVVIDELVATNPSIKVVGDNKAYIYIGNVSNIDNFALNYKGEDAIGNSANTVLYLSGNAVALQNGRMGAETIYVNAETLNVQGSAKVSANIETGANEFVITGGATEVTGTVCAPNAESKVIDRGTLYGQLHTNTLVNNGTGNIIYKADAAVGKVDVEPDPVVPVDPPVEDKDDAVCVKLDVRKGTFTPGMMDAAPLRPHDDRFGDNDTLVLPGFEDVWYTVLIEDTFKAKDEAVPQRLKDAAEIIAANAQARLNELEYSWETVQFGRIDSQAWKKDEYVNRNGQSTLLITPFINSELTASGVNHDELMWLAVGDRNGNLLYVYVMDREMAGIENLIDGE